MNMNEYIQALGSCIPFYGKHTYIHTYVHTYISYCRVSSFEAAYIHTYMKARAFRLRTRLSIFSFIFCHGAYMYHDK